MVCGVTFRSPSPNLTVSYTGDKSPCFVFPLKIDFVIRTARLKKIAFFPRIIHVINIKLKHIFIIEAHDVLREVRTECNAD